MSCSGIRWDITTYLALKTGHHLSGGLLRFPFETGRPFFDTNPVVWMRVPPSPRRVATPQWGVPRLIYLIQACRES